ncbi:MAG: hypothetical protein M3P45_09565 [Acidobacteriota bacterium]|nr:hypothetical protein [Acidobacteriota bacterium]
MRNFIAAILCVCLVGGATPAKADFKYSDTSKITGGTLKSMMKTVGIFSKQASQAMKPITTTRYIKGDFMRSDEADGRVQIIDLAGRRIIHIDSQQHTYTEMTFEEMKAAMQKAQEQAQQKMDKETKKQDVQANLNAKINVTPGTGSRQIQGLTANEMKIQIDLEIQAQQQNQQASGQPNQPVSGTISTSIDSWVAPAVPGYEEVADFYKRMAKEINWVPPSNIRIDPRVSQSMDELQKNQAAFKGLPLLQYLSMTMVGQQGSAGSTTDNGAGASNPDSSSSNSNNAPSSASDAMVKGLGGLFGKKKKKDDAAEQQNSQNPPPPSTPGALIEMTIEVTSFSNAALDASLFEIPAGYTRVQQSPDIMFKQQGKP